MKPTQQEIIELAREASMTVLPDETLWWAVHQDELERFATLLLERFGAGGGEPVAWLNPYGGVVQVRATGHEKEHFTIPLYTQPSPSDLRAEYLRGLEDAAKVADANATDARTRHAKFRCVNIAEAIRALKGKQ